MVSDTALRIKRGERRRPNIRPTSSYGSRWWAVIWSLQNSCHLPW